MKKSATFLLLTMFLLPISAFCSSENSQRIEDWTVSCKVKDGKDVCSIFQILESNDEKRDKIATIKIHYSGENGLKMVEVLPFGVNIKSGSSIVCDGNKLVASGEFITCYDHGCVAHANLSKEDLEVIINSTNNHIRIVSMNGKVVDIPFSNKGLKLAVENLEKMDKSDRND
ncbi:MAG: invasion associated locus B family protein [Rickettsiaceae bacterium]|nr:invasion associated locus B family protein [Rickettsiaceae bacterium]